MRELLILVAVLGAASPALAQPTYSETHRLNDLEAQQQLARQQGVALANELNALDARLRTEQALDGIAQRRRPPPLPMLPQPPSRPVAKADDGTGYVSIPDARLHDPAARP